MPVPTGKGPKSPNNPDDWLDMSDVKEQMQENKEIAEKQLKEQEEQNKKQDELIKETKKSKKGPGLLTSLFSKNFKGLMASLKPSNLIKISGLAMGSPAMMLIGDKLGDMGADFKAMRAERKQSDFAQEDKDNEKARQTEEQTKQLTRIADGVEGMEETTKDKKGGGLLGMLFGGGKAGLIAVGGVLTAIAGAILPILGIVAAIAALAGAVYLGIKHADKIKEMFGKLRDKMGPVGDLLATLFSDFFEFAKAVVDLPIQLVKKLSEIFTTDKSIGEVLKEAGGILLEGALEIGKAFVDIFKNFYGTIFSFISRGFKDTWDMIKAIWSDKAGFIKALLSGNIGEFMISKAQGIIESRQEGSETTKRLGKTGAEQKGFTFGEAPEESAPLIINQNNQSQQIISNDDMSTQTDDFRLAHTMGMS
jgi:hypothetical protein